MGINRVLVAIAALLGLASAAENEFFGYFNVNPTYGVHLWYWGFGSRNNITTDPVVIWLTGGPGCSSELALFFENGPYQVTPDLNLTTNPYSWNNNATVIYVDQPGGTGFSYVDNPAGYVHNETQVGDEMYNFLQQFFTLRPDLSKQPFFITGESYGGHYVTAISRRVQLGIQNHEGLPINFQGLSIGNGWVDPINQYASYGPYAYAHKLINRVTLEETNVAYRECKKLISNGDYSSAFVVCSGIVSKILSAAGNINPYDITKQCTYPPMCYDLEYITDFLNLPSTRKRLGVTTTWQPCSQSVYTPLEEDFVHSFRSDLPYLLADYRVFIYEGVNDIMCNFYGSSNYLASMQWSGQQAFNTASNRTWAINGKTVGSVRSASGLTYINVLDAGHMVPHDQPIVALNIFNNLIFNKPF
eukprot:TRINITY_DN1055_c0_g1_i2.p1 TRINITY_DN1055_c0_g1~~TRINITY_DN1055_c0_g1_i2.p1  ORF type:complete len:416 (-),score=177.20 TRINITY_DN1055_c0_g1_i2:171-1418(-)